MAVGLLALVLVIGLAGLIALAVVGVVVLSRRSQLGYARQNTLVPGHPPSVPPAWAGSHEPEAVLHRRLVSALSGLRQAEAAAGGAVDAGSVDLRVQVQARAQDLDRRLVAVSVLPARPREQAQAALGEEVATVEGVAGSLGQRLAVGGASPDAPALESLGQRLRALDGPGRTRQPGEGPGAVGPGA